MQLIKHHRIVFSSAIIFLIILGVFSFAVVKHAAYTDESITSFSTRSVQQTNILTYKGKNGIDALTLLKQTASITQNQSGFVIAINNRVANASHREYWEFFINGKLATVGPASYLTKNNDILSWKLARY